MTIKSTCSPEAFNRAAVQFDRDDAELRFRIDNPSESSDDEILNKIERLQNIQKRHAPTSGAWIAASIELKPLFEEMARRS